MWLLRAPSRSFSSWTHLLSCGRTGSRAELWACHHWAEIPQSLSNFPVSLSGDRAVDTIFLCRHRIKRVMGTCVDIHTQPRGWGWGFWQHASVRFCRSKFKVTFKAQHKRSCLQKALPPGAPARYQAPLHMCYFNSRSALSCAPPRDLPGWLTNRASSEVPSSPLCTLAQKATLRV